MLLSLIFCLLASTFAANDTCPANPNSPSCDDPVEETICQLTCNRDSGECAQSDEAKCGEIGVDLASETYPNMYPTRCKEICELSRDHAVNPESVCRFYKVSSFGKEVFCSLMNDEQCTATGPCGTHCVSGDVGCKDTPIPGPQDCPAAFEYTDSAFHFGCDHCNPYSDETCKEGNKCFTTERCSEWDNGLDHESPYYRKLAIECTRFGTWARLAGSGGSDEDYTDVLNGGAAPTEPNCKPLPVEILPGVLTEEGADFLCDIDLAMNDAGTHYEIVAPNTCVLLCDFHLSMSLECLISEEEGETKCYDDGDTNPTSAENIYCWVPPTEGTGPPVTTTTPSEDDPTTPDVTTPEATTLEATTPEDETTTAGF